MNIGTPLSTNATKVLLLGSGELGKELTISLQRLGVEVVAVDRYANAPAHQVAHRSHVVDMTDAKALKRIIDQERPQFVIPEIEAIATDLLLEVERQGLATVVPNARAVQLTMNREGIRTLAAEQVRVPTSNYAFADSFSVLKRVVEEKIGYPCFIKPTMSSSGKGQSLVQSFEQLEAAWEYAKAAGRTDTGKVIVESKINFDFEITLLTVRATNSDGRVETAFCEPIGHLQKSGDYRESWQPQPMSAQALAKAQDVAKKITDAIGGLGLFGVELFVSNEDVWFSEVSPRPHDTGMVTMITQRQSEFDLHARAILGLPVSTRMAVPGASAVILSGIESKNVAYQGLESALSEPDCDVRLFAKPEALVNRRMGVVLAASQNVDIARNKAVIAASKINLIETLS